jgi:drug/metabolite transporter (DMT)-like permease
LKEPITLQGALRLGLAVIGVLLVLKQPNSPWPVPSSLPDWLALGGGFTFALTNVLLKRLHKTTETGRLFAMFAGGAIIALLVGWAGTLAGVVTALPVWNTPLALAVIGMGAVFLIGNLALQYGASRLKSSTTSLVMLTEIVFASLSAVWLGAALLEVRVLWGAALIFSAAVWAAL